MDFNFIQFRLGNRPYAANSTGRPRGTLKRKGGRVQVFEAIGTAREEFADKISKDVLKHLDDNGSKLQYSATYVGLSLFMMGKGAERAKPVVMFVSDDKRARLEAYEAVKESTILEDFPGFGIGHMDLGMEYESFQQLAD